MPVAHARYALVMLPLLLVPAAQTSADAPVQSAGPGVFPSDACVLVDVNNQNRFPPASGGDGSQASGVLPLQASEVRVILGEVLNVANQARAGIRRAGDQTVRVTISVVDSMGAILGIVSSCDAPVFGVSVSLQQARAAALTSSATIEASGGDRSVGNIARPMFPDGFDTTTSAGGVPIYRDGVAIGGLGISGDGIDDMDQLASMALNRAAAILAEMPQP